MNLGNGYPTSKFFQKANKKQKSNEDTNAKKVLSGNKMDLPLNKRKPNLVNAHTKLSSIDEKGTVNVNFYKQNNNNNGNGNITKKKKIKKSLTINKMYKFRAGEMLEKKINNIKIKDNKY